MQEIAPHVFVETAYAGVTLGAISGQHGMVLIDAPFRPDDTRSWRSALLNLGGGVDRLLVNLDAHVDRSLGARAMDCTIVGHALTAAVFRNRPVTFKVQSGVTGAEWELYNGLGNVRWAPPDLTFTDRLVLHWNSSPVVLEHHPGQSSGAIWVILPEQKVIFVGDAIVPDAPPLLANAEIPVWIENLKLLQTRTYQNYTLVSGRGGVIPYQQIDKQIKFLDRVARQMEKLAERAAKPEDTEPLATRLLDTFEFDPERKELYQNRLRYGLRQYYLRNHSPEGANILEE